MANETVNTELLHRDIGRLEGRIQALEGRVGRNEEATDRGFRDVNVKLDRIEEAMEGVKVAAAGAAGMDRGRRAVLTAIGAVIGAIVTGIFELIRMWTTR